MNNWSLVNVVWYDGSDAYVSKFILRTEGYEKLTEESEGLLGQYLSGNGEILKTDILYNLTFENIMAMENEEDVEKVTAFNRFKEMYF